MCERCEDTGFDAQTRQVCVCEVLNPLSPEDEALLRHCEGLDDVLPQVLHQGTRDKKKKAEFLRWADF